MLANKLPVTFKGKYGLWRIINLLTIGMLAGGVLFTYYFIYQNLYNTLTNVDAIATLRSAIPLYDIDFKVFEHSKNAIALKNNIAKPPTDMRNIFFYSEIVTSPYATSTQP